MLNPFDQILRVKDFINHKSNQRLEYVSHNDAVIRINFESLVNERYQGRIGSCRQCLPRMEAALFAIQERGNSLEHGFKPAR